MLRAEQRGVSAAGRPKALLGWEGWACWTLGHLKPLLLVGRFPFNGGYFVFLYEVWAEHGGYLWEGFCPVVLELQVEQHPSLWAPEQPEPLQ